MLLSPQPSNHLSLLQPEDSRAFLAISTQSSKEIGDWELWSSSNTHLKLQPFHTSESAQSLAPFVHLYFNFDI